MHPGLFLARSDDVSLRLGQFHQPAADNFFRLKQFSKSHVSAVMAGFGFEQAAIEIGEVTVSQSIAQQTEPLARAGLDQRSNKQSIDGPQRLLLANQLMQLRPIRR